MTLTLFTNITEQLTTLEKQTLVPMLLDTLRLSHSGNRMKGRWLTGWLRACGHVVTEPRLRKMMNYIRVTNAAQPYVLIGAANGYYLTANVQEVEDQIQSLEGRIDAIEAARDAIISQCQNLKRKCEDL
ncbi:MAG: hypothetical protein IT249_20010 [Chitinophagaceae bacterium]|nr:hypothetical protein [Chitinophagaceae bacterium]